MRFHAVYFAIMKDEELDRNFPLFLNRRIGCGRHQAIPVRAHGFYKFPYIWDEIYVHRVGQNLYLIRRSDIAWVLGSDGYGIGFRSLKRWRLGEIVRKAVQVGVDPNAVDLDSTQTTAGQKSLAPKSGRKS